MIQLILLILGVGFIFASCVPGAERLFQAGVGVSFLALGWPLLAELN